MELNFARVVSVSSSMLKMATPIRSLPSPYLNSFIKNLDRASDDTSKAEDWEQLRWRRDGDVSTAKHFFRKMSFEW